ALFPHSLHDALPICGRPHTAHLSVGDDLVEVDATSVDQVLSRRLTQRPENRPMVIAPVEVVIVQARDGPLRGRVVSQPLRDALSGLLTTLSRGGTSRAWTIDRKSRRLNCSHVSISSDVFCLINKDNILV